MAGLLP
ncbi:hypothetical protein YPPY48_1903, partial [Yersinia pestis PY-48]